METQNNESPFGEVIFAYTRAEAIEDGELVDISNLAKQAGFKIPTAVTRGVYADCIAVDRADEGIQDIEGRAWDILNLAGLAIRAVQGRSDEAHFKVNVASTKFRGGSKTFPLWIKASREGEGGTPVLTIMHESED